MIDFPLGSIQENQTRSGSVVAPGALRFVTLTVNRGTPLRVSASFGTLKQGRPFTSVITALPTLEVAAHEAEVSARAAPIKQKR
ncbi:hypothetical protein [Massilia sp. TWP1-3-3]|uniref:hypothetical protein n=1 Tax=Massilia sp. TWP1-3-3 TaxID=2804573 RepID=UPI003CEDF6B5